MAATIASKASVDYTFLQPGLGDVVFDSRG